MPDELLPKTRRLRLEALAQALRRFGMTDDGQLSELICRPGLPSLRHFAQALRHSHSRIPPGVSAQFVAHVVLSHIAGKEKRLDKFEDPFQVPLAVDVVTPENLHLSVFKILEEFKRAVEYRRGYALLWNGARARSEKDAQALFDVAVRGWCQALGLDLQAEVNLGRGPVDFRLSRGPVLKAIVEMKLARHGRFWNGLTEQLPTYMRVEGLDAGYFVTVVFSDADAVKVKRIEAVIGTVRNRVGFEIHSIVVDARKHNKKSASKMGGR